MKNLILIILLLVGAVATAQTQIDRNNVPIAVYDNIDTTKFVSIVDGVWYSIDRESLQPLGRNNSEFGFGIAMGILIGGVIVLGMFVLLL